VYFSVFYIAKFSEIILKYSTKTWILVGSVTVWVLSKMSLSVWVLSKMSCLLSTFGWGDDRTEDTGLCYMSTIEPSVLDYIQECGKTSTHVNPIQHHKDGFRWGCVTIITITRQKCSGQIILCWQKLFKKINFWLTTPKIVFTQILYYSYNVSCKYFVQKRKKHIVFLIYTATNDNSRKIVVNILLYFHTRIIWVNRTCIWLFSTCSI